jgi:hypothetical protein
MAACWLKIIMCFFDYSATKLKILLKIQAAKRIATLVFISRFPFFLLTQNLKTFLTT